MRKGYCNKDDWNHLLTRQPLIAQNISELEMQLDCTIATKKLQTATFKS